MAREIIAFIQSLDDPAGQSEKRGRRVRVGIFRPGTCSLKHKIQGPGFVLGFRPETRIKNPKADGSGLSLICFCLSLVSGCFLNLI